MKQALVVLAAAGLLAACSSSTTESTPTATASPGEPSAALVTWAGQVCTDTSALRTSITDIGSAVTSGAADLPASIAQQFTLVQQSADALLSTVTSIPSDASGPDAEAIQQSSDDLNTAVEALGTSISELTGSSGIGFAKALVGVGSAASEAGQAAIDSVEAIDAAIKNRSAAIGKAFQASPSCTELTAEQQ